MVAIQTITVNRLKTAVSGVGQKRTADIGHSVIHPLTYSGGGEACLGVASAVPLAHGIEPLELGC